MKSDAQADAPSTHAAVLLAAGGSLRLGRPKQLLQRDGVPMVRRVLELLRQTRPRQLIVVLGGYAHAVQEALGDVDGPGEGLVSNASWRSGLGGSIGIAIAALRAHDGPLLVTGCDQPALSLQHLQGLLQGAAASTSGCAATRHGDGVGSPAVLSPAMLSPASQRQTTRPQGDRGFGAQLSALGTGALLVLEVPELQFDLDTEEDVRAAVERGWLDPGATRAE